MTITIVMKANYLDETCKGCFDNPSKTQVCSDCKHAIPFQIETSTCPGCGAEATTTFNRGENMHDGTGWFQCNDKCKYGKGHDEEANPQELKSYLEDEILGQSFLDEYEKERYDC